ncbi:hypothetical protein CHELA1G11_13889 [Hyphomicrobiales bacterium]|nr:hypothetical protein CHELA1G2_10425 [Hyphomicrobiales bacterium]CAH1674746.1 hypothetical protein CHELA1G11_13889 [Hyphomicrobiales bacterium]
MRTKEEHIDPCGASDYVAVTLSFSGLDNTASQPPVKKALVSLYHGYQTYRPYPRPAAQDRLRAGDRDHRRNSHARRRHA